MTQELDQPQIYLITPPDFELSVFPNTLAKVLDNVEIGCVRLSLSSTDESRIAKAADACRAVTHERDVALVIDSHVMLVERLGLDGVHLTDGARSIGKVRKDLGDDAIIGSFCGTSRHDGLNAGEMGADYVSFGPVGASALGDGSVAEHDLFEWWSQMIEVPVVAEGALSQDLVRSLSPATDFFGIGSEIWNTDDPVDALKSLKSAFS